VRALGYWGVWSVASGLLLDALLTAAKRAGLHEVWTGSGLDVLFGGGASKAELDSGRGRTFHERFWNRTLALVERDYGSEDPVNVYGAVASAHGLRMRMPFEGFPTARLARRLDASVLYGEDGADKVPLRLLAERLGVPRELPARPKAAFHAPSGMLGLLEALMEEDAALWCPDDLDHPPFASAETRLGLRYFIARVASDVSPLRLKAAQVSARRRMESPVPRLAAAAPRRRARRG
jgi:asparagine synthetase B (glutamine-hydrolysing)